jgi:NTE family protein
LNHPLVSPVAATLFGGVPLDTLERSLRHLARRQFAAGTVVISEGDRLREMYIVETGDADVSVVDRWGSAHHVNRVGPGDVLGEMSMFTGRTASATVRALQDLTVIVLSDLEFHELADAFPRLYHNLGAIVSRKLYRADRLRLDTPPTGAVTVLDGESEPLAGYGLASSLAWHARAPVLLIAFGTECERALGCFAAADASAERCLSAVLEGSSCAAEPRAHVLLAAGHACFAASPLAHTLDRLTDCFKHVLVQGPTFSSVAARHLPSIGRLNEMDEQALFTGLLPPTTAAGRALGWAARDLAGLKVGVALGAGGMRGFAHVGVLAALAKAQIPVDFVAGCSVGALVGALFAVGRTPEEIAELLARGGATGLRPTVSIHSLLSDAPLRRWGQQVIGSSCIEDLSPRLAIVAADILTGDEVVFRRGPLWPAVLASCAIPGVLPAQRMGRRVLVDGGVVDPVPAGVVAEMGADVIFAVNLRADRRVRRIEEAATEPLGRAPSVVEVVTRSIEIMQSRVATPKSTTSIVIEPECAGALSWDFRQFARGLRYVSSGQAAVEQSMPRIATVLPWVDWRAAATNSL